MMQNLDISDALIRLGKKLSKDSDIADFCNEQFKKAVTVFVGDTLRSQEPTFDKTPYIVITDFQKQEGQNVEFCSYSFTIYVGVGGEKSELVEDENGLLMPDLFDVGAKFMTLIEAVLNDPKKNLRPCSKVNTAGPFPLDPAGRHWLGKMQISKRIYQHVGTSYQEDFDL